MQEDRDNFPVLVTGASGYIGGRLVPRLLQAGYGVRAMARDLEKLHQRSWASHPRIELVQADVLDRDSLTRACRGCWAAYYLVHSMNPQEQDFARTDLAAARSMTVAAAEAGLERIIYLGGLGEPDEEALSHHLRSRLEVARVLREGKVPVTVLRAAMIIGSGSASFEILRYLVERLPVMITPRWVETPCQPIGVRNVLNYLVGALDCPQTSGDTFDIGQPEVLTYRRLMEIYAEEAGLPKRLIIPVPVLTPRLSSYWIHLVTPVPASLARPLAEGLRNEVICRDERIRQLIPQDLFEPRRAIRKALARVRQQDVESSWSDAGRIPPAEWSTQDDPEWAGGTVFVDCRELIVEAPPEKIWPALSRLGGHTGWYYADWLWRLRGFMDRLIGGVGLARGRRSVEKIRPGDALDFWRVAAVEKPHRLLLIAEMKLPGQAVLEVTLHSLEGQDRTRVRQSARFRPKGLFGILYWYAVTPFHAFVFNGLLKGIAEAADAAILKGPQRCRSEEGRSR